ncbi:hypothetical protein [Methylosinus sp. Sm6]|uniref:hypothetical protein n=1 Tax=Methylosinus sp. Sm6 TaxID=2866948 RepID=UPI001C98EB70|nr:hypothetical protein [Methylosinus sp. Sm6]MBY6239659.1 hypothetical protein [Methylosinus sp. Sm6]
MNELSLAFTPLLPWPALAALGAVAIALAILSLRAGGRGAVLRLCAFALVLLALCDPSLVREQREPSKTIVPVVLDRSESQSFGERQAQTDAAREALERAFAALGDVEPRFIDSARHGGDSDGTRLFQALEDGMKDVPRERVGAAILVTDGIVHDIPASAAALGFVAPVHALVTGHEGERDRRLELIEAPRFGIVGKDQIIRARVVDSNIGGREPLVIEMRRDGEPLPRVVARAGETVDIPVRVEHGGQNVVELEAATLPGELTAVNNKAVVAIEGVRDKLKVLLVSGEPHPGERSWRNLLRSDANVELVHFTILRPPEKLDGTPPHELSLIAFPTADLFGRKINEFDLIIFDRYSNQTILPSVYFDNILRYVENGGAFLVATGPDFATVQGLYYSPLESIIPARPDGALVERAFRAHVTADGEKHPVTRGLEGAGSDPPSWGEWFRLVEADVVKGNSLLAGVNERPLLVLAREGKGRVAALLTDQMWLWARGFEGGGPHVDLTRRLAHWLMKEPDLEEEALRASTHGHDILIERQSLTESDAPATMTAPSGARSQIALAPAAPGLSRAHHAAQEMGLYRFESGELKALVNVGPENPREFREVASTLEKLRPLAEATGGTVRRLARAASGAITLPRIVELREASVFGGVDYLGVKRTQASALRGVEVAPLALGFLGLAALLGAIVAAWAWEGRR